MRLDVALLPRDCIEPESCICIIVDALRATSTLAVLFGRGASLVAVAGTIEDARLLHGDMPGSLLCGEVGGLPPEGFDFGNSPAEFEETELGGRPLVLATRTGGAGHCSSRVRGQPLESRGRCAGSAGCGGD
jgi:2-phosphosulfolactate phosphatase